MNEQVASARIRKMRAYDAAALSNATGVDTGAESLTQQQFREDCDANVIVRRFGGIGNMPVPSLGAFYVDLTGVSDAESATAFVDGVRAAFERLPAEFRDRFGNDAHALLEYAATVPQDVLEREVREAAAPPVVPPAGGGAGAPGGGTAPAPAASGEGAA